MDRLLSEVNGVRNLGGSWPTRIEKPANKQFGKTFHIRGQSISALDKVGNL